MIEIHGFLDHFDALRAHCDGVLFDGLTNPVDGVFYPGVSIDIPDYVKQEVAEKLSILEDGEIRINALFLRLSLEGVKAPHQAHTDTVMGKKSMMLYLNRPEDCCGGTALVKHVSGMDRNPISEVQELIWLKDTNTPDKWEVTHLCRMQPNKAFIFDADLMHRAEPVSGFGSNPINGRLVLTAFYDC
ncbi:MAG: hypothetical protein V4563_17660 [Pseudomonadota bacterium]